MQIPFYLAIRLEECYTLRVIADYVGMLRLFRRDLRLYLITAALVGLAWDGMRAVLLNLYLLRLGYGPQFIGLINSLGTLAFSLLCLPAGTLGTRWGSRNVLITGTGLMAVGFCLLPMAEFVAVGWRTSWLIATTILAHLGFALYLVNGLPFMMGTTSPRERNHAFSIHVAVIPLASFVGSLLAGALPGATAGLLGLSLDQAAPYRYPLWLAALLFVPAGLVLFAAQPSNGQEEPVSPVSPRFEADDRAPIGLILAIALFMALRFGGRSAVMTFFNVYLDEALEVSTALVGALIAIGQFLSVPTALLSPMLVKRWGNLRVILGGTLGMVLFVLPLALIPNWIAAGLGFVSSSSIFLITVAPIRVFSQELVSPRWRASMASAFMMGAGLASSAMALASGYIIEALGYSCLFLIVAGLVAAAAAQFWFCFRLPRGEFARQSSSGGVD